MNPDVQMSSGGGPPPPKPRKDRDGPYQRPTGDLQPDSGLLALAFPVRPSEPLPLMPVEPTPKQRARRSRAGPYDEPEEEELVPESGMMNISTFFGPQPSETQGSKRPIEAPEASRPKKPASGPMPWPAPPTRPAAREEEETLVPESGIMQLSYPSTSSSSSSSSGPPPPPETRQKATVLTAQPAEEEELLQPTNAVMELAIPPALARNLSVGNQKVW